MTYHSYELWFIESKVKFLYHSGSTSRYWQKCSKRHRIALPSWVWIIMAPTCILNKNSFICVDLPFLPHAVWEYTFVAGGWICFNWTFLGKPMGSGIAQKSHKKIQNVHDIGHFFWSCQQINFNAFSLRLSHKTTHTNQHTIKYMVIISIVGHKQPCTWTFLQPDKWSLGYCLRWGALTMETKTSQWSRKLGR